VEERVRAVAQGALRRLGSGSLSDAVRQVPGEALRLERLTLAQLSNLAYLQAEDPLVQEVVEAIRTGRPVHLDRPSVEAHLGLTAYPPRMQEQFARWFSRISGYGIHLTGAQTPPGAPAQRTTPAATTPAAPAGAGPAADSPEREVLADILGSACSSERPCVLEPGKGCCGSGRCKTLGF